MPGGKPSLRKPKEVPRLRFELKLGYRQIGRSCPIGVGAVHKYLKRAEAASFTWRGLTFTGARAFSKHSRALNYLHAEDATPSRGVRL